MASYTLMENDSMLTTKFVKTRNVMTTIIFTYIQTYFHLQTYLHTYKHIYIKHLLISIKIQQLISLILNPFMNLPYFPPKRIG